MKKAILFLALSACPISIGLASSGHLSITCEWLDTNYYFCEAQALNFSEPQPFKFYWTIHGNGPYLVPSYGLTSSFRTVTCGLSPPVYPHLEVELRDANDDYVAYVTIYSPCG